MVPSDLTFWLAARPDGAEVPWGNVGARLTRTPPLGAPEARSVSWTQLSARTTEKRNMFELGPEKLLIILAAVFIFLGPKELPAAARNIGAAVRQMRELQAQLLAEVGSMLPVASDATPADTPIEPHHPTPHPEAGDSFN